MSTLSEMIEVDELRFIEPDYASLINNGEPGIMINDSNLQISFAKLLVDETGTPVMLAVHLGYTWFATGYLFRNPTEEEINLFKNLDGDMYSENRNLIEAAFREEFSEHLKTAVSPALDDLTTERIEKVRSLLTEQFGNNLSGTCIDACCGSGLGSSLMRELGCKILSYDNDDSLLSLGFSSGRLHTDETISIDGCCASAYLPNAEYGIGLMFGQMYSYTKEIWQPIVEELVGITEKTLITVATEEEAHWVQEWAQNLGRHLEITENTRDPIYDRWICFG